VRVVKVYRSARRTGTYLFVDAHDELSRVPAELAKHFGAAVEVMELELTPERRLAQASAAEVLDGIHDSGFYLQLPPEIDPVTGERRTS
jgi:uncharacterized protein YcgL (UPF0745 family)